jgi:hypothetical protein
MLAVTGHGNSWFTMYRRSRKSVLQVSLQDAFYLSVFPAVTSYF